MGSGASSNSQDDAPEDFEALKQTTHFKTKEIEDLYEKFKEDFPDGNISKPDFIRHYQQMFPGSNAVLFAQNVFRAYDVDNNGVISFKEFLCALSVTSRGTVAERLEWTFKMYDADGDGHIDREEATDILNAVFKLRGQAGCRELAEEEAHKIFIALDKDMDDRLSMLEFVMGAKNCSLISLLLGPTGVGNKHQKEKDDKDEA